MLATCFRRNAHNFPVDPKGQPWFGVLRILNIKDVGQPGKIQLTQN